MKMRLSKNQIFLVVISLLAVVVTAGFTVWGRTEKAQDFLTAKVERGSIRNTVSATGTLQAVTTVQVGSQVSGTIAALYADFNSAVRKDQVIAQLDPSILQAQVASSSANLDQARADLVDAQARVLAAKATVENQRAGVSSATANLAALRAQRDDAASFVKRQEALSEDGLIAQRDLETSRTTYEAAQARYEQADAQLQQAQVSERAAANAGLAQAEAQVKQAQAQVQQALAALHLSEVNLSHTTIRSPIDGVVISRNVDVGQTVAASLSAPTLFTIANDLTHMQVMASIDQADIGAINQTSRVSFTVDAFPGQSFEGTIGQLRLNPQNVQNVVTYNVMIDVRNPDLKLMPGMTTNLAFVVAERPDVIKIPNAALRFTPPGMTREQIRETLRVSPEGNNQSETSAVQRQKTQSEDRHASGDEARQDRGRTDRLNSPAGGENPWWLVWILSADQQLQPRRIRTGVTDGIMTEVLQGNLHPGELIIVGQNAGRSSSAASQTPPAFSGPFRGLGGAGRR
jgi:HlyD family secretion protein